MTNKEILKKEIIYRSQHRGFKEMDLILGQFVKKYIEIFNEDELNDLNKLLFMEDELIYKWYLDKKSNIYVPNNKVSMLLKKFRV